MSTNSVRPPRTNSKAITRYDSLFSEARSNALDCSASVAIRSTSLSLPATAECPVELDDTQQLVTATQGQTSFGLKEFAVGVECVQQGRYATGVAQVGKT